MKQRIITYSVLAVTGVITFVAYSYINRKVEEVKHDVIYMRRKYRSVVYLFCSCPSDLFVCLFQFVRQAKILREIEEQKPVAEEEPPAPTKSVSNSLNELTIIPIVNMYSPKPLSPPTAVHRTL